MISPLAPARTFAIRGDEEFIEPNWHSAARGTPTRLTFAALYGAAVKRLKEARNRQVATLQPWLILLDLTGAA